MGKQTNYVAPDLPFEWLLSDDLKMLNAEFAKHKGGDLLINADALDVVLKRFQKAIERSRKLENLISRKEWNARAKKEQSDRQADDILVRALGAPGSNVVLFGNIDVEVPFSDGRE